MTCPWAGCPFGKEEGVRTGVNTKGGEVDEARRGSKDGKEITWFGEMTEAAAVGDNEDEEGGLVPTGIGCGAIIVRSSVGIVTRR